MATITALLISVFLFGGCTPATIQQQKVRYEEELFLGAETETEKVDILNHEFMKILFSIDSVSDENVMLKLNLYSTPSFIKNFEENTLPYLKGIQNRDFKKITESQITEGIYKIDKTEVPAYEVVCIVEYQQDIHLLRKKMKTVYAIVSGEIKIIELQELDIDILDK